MPLHATSVGSRAGLAVSCDARWLMAYAAAVGAFLPSYFDTERAGGIVAHPLFPVAPEWALLTQGPDPFGLGLDRSERARGVHATHRLSIGRPVAAGDRLQLVAEIVGVESLPAGPLATVRFDAVADDGCTVWTSWMGTIYRGVRLVGEDRPPAPAAAPLPVPSGDHPVAVTREVREGDAHIYTECARIWNPIHTDVAVARGAGLPDIILHGTATLAHGVTAVMEHRGLAPADVTGISGSFRAMVLLPSALTIEMRDDGCGVCGFEVLVGGRPAIREGMVTYRRQ